MILMSTCLVSGVMRGMSTLRRLGLRSGLKKGRRSKWPWKCHLWRRITRLMGCWRYSSRAPSPCASRSLLIVRFQKLLVWKNFIKSTRTPPWSRFQPKRTRSACRPSPSRTCPTLTSPWRLRLLPHKTSQRGLMTSSCRTLWIVRRIRSFLWTFNWRRTWIIRGQCRRKTR